MLIILGINCGNISIFDFTSCYLIRKAIEAAGMIEFSSELSFREDDLIPVLIPNFLQWIA